MTSEMWQQGPSLEIFRRRRGRRPLTDLPTGKTPIDKTAAVKRESWQPCGRHRSFICPTSHCSRV